MGRINLLGGGVSAISGIEEYSALKTYSLGEQVSVNGVIVYNETPVVIPEPYDYTKWIAVDHNLVNGVITGGSININAGDNTLFDHDDITVVFVVRDDFEKPRADVFTIPARVGLPNPLVATDVETQVLVDRLLQDFVYLPIETARDVIEQIDLGVMLNNINIPQQNLWISEIGSPSSLVQANKAFYFAAGGIGLGDSTIKPFTGLGGLQVETGAFDVIREGRNKLADKNSPDVTPRPILAPVTANPTGGSGLFYDYFDSTAISGSNPDGYVFQLAPNPGQIDFDNYNALGTSLTPVPLTGNQYQIQRVVGFGGSNNTFVTYGQKLYSSLDEAVSQIPNDPYKEFELRTPGAFLGWVIGRRGLTNWTTFPNDFAFIPRANLLERGLPTFQGQLRSAYGTFALNADKTYAIVNTTEYIEFTTDVGNSFGIIHSTVTNPELFTIDEPGLWSVVLEQNVNRSSGSGPQTLNTWLEIDEGAGFNALDNSTARVDMRGDPVPSFKPVNQVFSKGDVVRFASQVTDLNLFLDFSAAIGSIPQVASVSVTFNRLSS